MRNANGALRFVAARPRRFLAELRSLAVTITSALGVTLLSSAVIAALPGELTSWQLAVSLTASLATLIGVAMLAAATHDIVMSAAGSSAIVLRARQRRRGLSPGLLFAVEDELRTHLGDVRQPALVNSMRPSWEIVGAQSSQVLAVLRPSLEGGFDDLMLTTPTGHLPRARLLKSPESTRAAECYALELGFDVDSCADWRMVLMASVIAAAKMNSRQF